MALASVVCLRSSLISRRRRKVESAKPICSTSNGRGGRLCLLRRAVLPGQSIAYWPNIRIPSPALNVNLTHTRTWIAQLLLDGLAKGYDCDGDDPITQKIPFRFEHNVFNALGCG